MNARSTCNSGRRWGMAEIISIHSKQPKAGPPEHVALRVLIKYLSHVIDVPYKSIAGNTTYNEDAVKSYANDKAMNASAQEMYNAFVGSCEPFVQANAPKLKQYDYIVQVLHHLYEESWL